MLRWDEIAAHIDTRGDGVPVVVFNTLSWPRTGVMEICSATAGSRHAIA